MHRPSVRAWVPRYGSVRSLVCVALVGVVVLRAREPLRETLATALSVDPATAWLGVLVALGLLAVAVLAVEVRRQARPFPAFLTPDVRDEFLRQRVPPRLLFAAYVALLGAGGYVALFARTSFFSRLDGALLVVRRLLATGDPGAFSLIALGQGALFVAGAVAFAHAADRVLVAGARAVIARRRE